MTENTGRTRFITKSEFGIFPENILDGIGLWNIREGTIIFSRPFAELLGYDNDENGNGFREWLKLVHPTDRKHLGISSARHFSEQEPFFQTELRIMGKSGTFRWFLVRSKAITEGGKKPYLVILTFFDVTASKKKDDDLKMTERMAHIGSWHYDPVSGKLAWSEMIYEITGLDRRKPPPSIAELALIVHPDDRAAFVAASAMALQSSEPYRLTYRIFRPDGDVRHVMSISEPCLKADGTLEFLAGTLQDVTELSRIKEALLEGERKYRLFVENSEEGIWSMDAKYVTTYANRKMAEMLGYEPEEMVGKHIVSFIPDNETKDRRMEMEKGIEEHIGRYEGRFRKKDGTVILTSVSATVLTDDNGMAYGFFAMLHDITGNKKREEAMRNSERQLRLSFDQAPMAMAITSLDFHFLKVNDSFCAFIGYSSSELVGKTFAEITHPDFIGRDIENVRKVASGELDRYETEKQYIRKDGTTIWGRLLLRMVRDDGGNPLYFFPMIANISAEKAAEEERKQLQSQLLQAQKMESVGRLAGGVAHDFNNMLLVILGNVEMALSQAGPENPLYADLQEIQKAAQRSSDLTRQLLAYARKQTAMPRIIDMNETVSGMLTMLRRLIGENIELEWKPGHEIWKVCMDPTQIGQILTNLIVNASDAISGSGKITLKTENAVIDKTTVTHYENIVLGQYVMLTVSDTGSGMPEETIGHLFEPYFTTKGTGKGTGLGLATIYGIVKQNGGFVNVSSRQGIGSTFTVYLPRIENEGTTAEEHQPKPVQRTGRETILLVEDDDSILNLVKTFLQRQGYRVVAVGTAAEAIAHATVPGNAIDLLLTDIIMPHMNGRELADRITSESKIRTLFMSGYSKDVITNEGLLKEGTSLIQKPFSMMELAQKVRQVLDDNEDT